MQCVFLPHVQEGGAVLVALYLLTKTMSHIDQNNQELISLVLSLIFNGKIIAQFKKDTTPLCRGGKYNYFLH